MLFSISLDGGLLVRSTSFPSVDQAIHNGDRGGSRTSLGSRRADFASTESLQMNQQAPIPVNSLPPTDENVEVVLNLNVVIFTGVSDIKPPTIVLIRLFGFAWYTNNCFDF